MTVTVRLIEAHHGNVSKLTKLCTVTGSIPAYADNGGATRPHRREIGNCTMLWKGQRLPVSVEGALAVSDGPITFATANVSVVPPDAKPGCGMCGPQPLAASDGEIRVSGMPHSLQFSLTPNPGSMLNAKPTVWFEVDVAIAD